MEEISYVQGFFALLIALFAGWAFSLPALHILGLAAIMWLAWIIARDLYYRCM